MSRERDAREPHRYWGVRQKDRYLDDEPQSEPEKDSASLSWMTWRSVASQIKVFLIHQQTFFHYLKGNSFQAPSG